MSVGGGAVFCPEGLDAASLGRLIYEGCGKINDNGELTVDLGKLGYSSTITICLLLELMRVARQRKCRVKTVNVAPQLRKLLSLYQIGYLVE